MSSNKKEPWVQGSLSPAEGCWGREASNKIPLLTKKYLTAPCEGNKQEHNSTRDRHC